MPVSRFATKEKAFAAFLKENHNHLECCYKNGNRGQEHIAKNDKDDDNGDRLFHVDFKMKFKSTKIGLFDTKTKRSDIDVPKKHDTLLKFIDKDKLLSTSRALIGGLLIPGKNT